MMENAAAIREHNRQEAYRTAQSDPATFGRSDAPTFAPVSPLLQTYLEKSRQTEEKWEKLHHGQFYTVPQVAHFLNGT